MDRRDFIKQGTGGTAGLKRALLWGAVIVVIFLFSKAGSAVNTPFHVFPSSGPSEDNGPSSFVQFLKVAGIVIAAIAAVVLLALILNFLEKKVAAIIPSPIKTWYTKHKRLISFLVNAVGLSAIAYYCIIHGYYTALVTGLLSFLFSIFRSRAEKKSNTNQPV